MDGRIGTGPGTGPPRGFAERVLALSALAGFGLSMLAALSWAVWAAAVLIFGGL